KAPVGVTVGDGLEALAPGGRKVVHVRPLVLDLLPELGQVGVGRQDAVDRLRDGGGCHGRSLRPEGPARYEAISPRARRPSEPSNPSGRAPFRAGRGPAGARRRWAGPRGGGATPVRGSPDRPTPGNRS